ncbi:anticodon nuclease [Sphingorhabdus sp. M41]|uniref:anticodon nuclease n=1 Tax=Sphingorhabdus sp. M41 TaxID=1806885 RepID=UPI00078D8469|nr:anticodon nuclease [Sphingorhabdus sp. M41]AMO72954.1 anticodon nuclease [Sphingorhabdus sp. M41]
MSEQDDNLAAKAKELTAADKKVQLIYAFNGIGKTRLSRALKNEIAPKPEDHAAAEPSRNKILYYNAFTEDLFSWDNDLENDEEYRLEIKANSFTDWILGVRGQDQNIIANFQRYTDDKLTPAFVPEVEQVTNRDGKRENKTKYPAITFSHDRGTESSQGIKISKGEESNLIWSIFFTLLQEVVDLLSEADPTKRDDNEYDNLTYVFIDDPVSSLDENHLIELAVDLAGLIARSRFQNGQGVKFVITTHNPLFYNVLCKELSGAACYLLKRNQDGLLDLVPKDGAANKSFSYHHHLKGILENAIAEGSVEKFHFSLLRNLYEKTANFLGYKHWTDLLKTAPDERTDYLKKVINHYSHRELSAEEIAEPTEQQKEDVAILLQNLINNYGYWQQEAQDG